MDIDSDSPQVLASIKLRHKKRKHFNSKAKSQPTARRMNKGHKLERAHQRRMFKIEGRRHFSVMP